MDQTVNTLRMIILGMKAINDLDTFDQLRNEVADHGLWVKAQLEALDAANTESK